MTRITLRPATFEDTPFCLRVYSSTHAEEMTLVNWTSEQKDNYLLMQFRAQAEQYRLHYPTAEYQIIEREGVRVGRLVTERKPDQLLLMDIALLPQYRNSGIGTGLIQQLMEESTQKGTPLVLRVEFFNPVIRLYTRLGFIRTRELNSIFQEMVWTPQRVPA